MKLTRCIALALFLAVGACEEEGKRPVSSSAAPTAGDTATSTNAAVRYRQVYASLGTDFLKQVNDWARGLPENDAALNEALVQHAGDIERLIEASKLSECDFAVEPSRGMETLLPHLSEVRALARVLKADAHRCLEADDADGALRRAGAAVRMGTHAGSRAQCVIETMIAQATVETGVMLVLATGQAAAGAPSAADTRAALDAVRFLEDVALQRVLLKDRDMVVYSLKNNLMNVPGGIARTWANVPQSQRDEAVADVNSVHARASGAWVEADALERLKEIAGEPQSERVRGLVPDFVLLKGSCAAVRSHIALARAVLGG